MPLPRRLAEINRVVTNRIVAPVASYLPGFGVVHHPGRRTGRSHTTPVNVFVDDHRYVIALTYGARTDWLRNVIAAGGCWLEHRGHLIRLTDPRMLTTAVGMASMPAIVRAILLVTDVTEFVELHR
jgi:deazaflavin-dependent oxidoreductase (nitroreductase family)